MSPQIAFAATMYSALLTVLVVVVVVGLAVVVGVSVVGVVEVVVASAELPPPLPHEDAHISPNVAIAIQRVAAEARIDPG